MAAKRSLTLNVLLKATLFEKGSRDVEGRQLLYLSALTGGL